MALKMMGLGFCLGVILLAAVNGIQAEDKKEEEEFALTLDHSNFSDTVSKHDIIVVEFYAPWYHNLSLSLFFLWFTELKS